MVNIRYIYMGQVSILILACLFLFSMIIISVPLWWMLVLVFFGQIFVTYITFSENGIFKKKLYLQKGQSGKIPPWDTASGACYFVIVTFKGLPPSFSFYLPLLRALQTNFLSYISFIYFSYGPFFFCAYRDEKRKTLPRLPASAAPLIRCRLRLYLLHNVVSYFIS